MNTLASKNETEVANFLRTEVKKESILELDFQNIAPYIDQWWRRCNSERHIKILVSEFSHFFLQLVDDQILMLFDQVGLRKANHAGISVVNIFTIDSPLLALVVHETLSELFHITDITYKYEEHKALYLKPTGENYRDWGNGYGDISPHSDDLYEDLDVDYLSLTVCRDQTMTPTSLVFPKDILEEFTDHEIFELTSMRAKFTSGKNVNSLKVRERKLIDFSEKFGLQFHLDFRVDERTGERMQYVHERDIPLLKKLRSVVISCNKQFSTPKTGTFLIIANHKVLHARTRMNLDKTSATEYAYHSNFDTTPRLLFRSKGPRREYFEV